MGKIIGSGKNILLSGKILTCLFFTNINHSSGQTGFSNAIIFGTTVTGDFINNFNGGLKRGFTYLGKEELTLTINTQKAGLWNNGFFFLHGINTHGNGASENLTGDLQVLSNIEAGDHTGLFECWYKHQFEYFSVLMGQHDMNSEFLNSKYSHIFINSSFGVMPSISLNMPVPIFPLAAPGIILKYETNKHFIYRLGMYDGNPGSQENNQYNLDVHISSLEGFFNIAECEYVQKEQDREIGNFKLGAYIHTGNFQKYPDTLNIVKQNYGFYMLLDKDLFPRSFHSGHGLCAFVQGGITDPTCNRVKYSLSGGFRYHGILPDRFKDQLGIGFTHISISHDFMKHAPEALSNETAMEATYVFQIAQRYSIQPCMQYIIHPGIIKNINNTLVGIMRFSLSY